MDNGPRKVDEFGAIRRSFDAIAEVYAAKFRDELDAKPYDRALLEAFSAELAPGAPVLDLGTGAGGQIGRFVADRGATVTGVDVSERAIESAARLNPTMGFVVADVRALPMADRSVAGIVAFYCLIYGEDADVLAALRECRRVLRPGGRLLASVHGPGGDVHFDTFEGVAIDITMRQTTATAFDALARGAELIVDEVLVRPPYPSEHSTERIYLRAHR